jgi:hypothetical protein
MSPDTTAPVAPASVPGVIVAGAAWLLSFFVARYLLDTWPQSQQWEFAIVSLPVLAFFWLVWVVQRALRRADELQRRIHLEALAMAFLTTMLAMMGLGLLEETPRGLIALPWRHLWLALLPLYGICYALSAWHYR